MAEDIAQFIVDGKFSRDIPELIAGLGGAAAGVAALYFEDSLLFHEPAGRANVAKINGYESTITSLQGSEATLGSAPEHSRSQANSLTHNKKELHALVSSHPAIYADGQVAEEVSLGLAEVFVLTAAAIVTAIKARRAIHRRRQQTKNGDAPIPLAA